MSAGKTDPNFWTRILRESGLESPGYHETVRDANLISKRKKEEKTKPKQGKK